MKNRLKYLLSFIIVIIISLSLLVVISICSNNTGNATDRETAESFVIRYLQSRSFIPHIIEKTIYDKKHNEYIIYSRPKNESDLKEVIVKVESGKVTGYTIDGRSTQVAQLGDSLLSVTKK